MSSQAERRTLKMHPRLLWDVIHRQAGSLSKAILEGVMNSVDAGATYCDVRIDRESFSVSDDGKGFASDEEITKFFETFGYPHEEGDAKYGRFRMGRGQMMAFGRNLWLTNEYKMLVDLKPQKNELGEDYALGYEFSRSDTKHKGCSVSVDLYEKLSPSALDSALREITEFVKYVHIPVKLNGKVVSTDPAKESWDEITDDAYIKRKAAGTLDVYNQGVLVCKMPSFRFGVSGVVVSKEAIEVNFARNDVQSTCPIWKRVVRRLKDDALEGVKRNAPLSESQRDYLSRGLANGEVSLADISESRVVTDVTGSHHPFSALLNLSRLGGRISVAPKGDRVAEMAHTRKMAFVVTDECAARFGASSAPEFAEIVSKIAHTYRVNCYKLLPIDKHEFSKVISSRHEPLKDTELNKAERLALKAIRVGADRLFRGGFWLDRINGTDTFSRSGERYPSPRKIAAGVSDTALGWTDGTHTIWIERRELKKIKEGHKGMMQLAGLLLHEYLHNGPDTDTHDHGVDFYERFHDIALRTTLLSDAANEMLKTVLKELRHEGKVVSNTLSHFEDNITEAADLGMGKGLEEREPQFLPQPEAVAAASFVPEVAPASVEKSARNRIAKEQEASEERVKQFVLLF